MAMAKLSSTLKALLPNLIYGFQNQYELGELVT